MRGVIYRSRTKGNAYHHEHDAVMYPIGEAHAATPACTGNLCNGACREAYMYNGISSECLQAKLNIHTVLQTNMYLVHS